MNFNTTDSVSPNCLICYCLLESSQFINRCSEDSTKIFNVYCRLLKIELIGSMQWNLSKEAAPFCDKCFNRVEEISVLHNQLKYIEGVINGILEKTQLKILKSRNCQGLNSGAVIRSDAELGRTDYFRLLAVRKYDPHVEISKRDKVSDNTVGQVPTSTIQVKIEHEDASSSPQYIGNDLWDIETPIDTDREIPSPVFCQEFSDSNDDDFESSEVAHIELGPQVVTTANITLEKAQKRSLKRKSKHKVRYCYNENEDIVLTESKDPDYSSKKSKLRNLKASSIERKFKSIIPMIVKERKTKIADGVNCIDPISDEKQKEVDERRKLGIKSIYTADGRRFYGGVEIKRIDGMYYCGACEKSYRLEGSITAHVRESHRDGFQKVACGSCGKMYCTLSGLRNHERIHGGSNYICELCGAGFRQRNNLMDHQRRIHKKIRFSITDT